MHLGKELLALLLFFHDPSFGRQEPQSRNEAAFRSRIYVIKLGSLFRSFQALNSAFTIHDRGWLLGRVIPCRQGNGG